MDKLKDLETQITQAEKRRADITADLEGVNTRLKSKLADQEAAIIDNKDTARIETDITALMVKRTGLLGAIDSLTARVERLQGYRREELKARNLTAAARRKAEIFAEVRKAYKAVEAAKSILDGIQPACTEYVALLRATDPQLQDQQFNAFVGAFGMRHTFIVGLEALLQRQPLAQFDKLDEPYKPQSS
jgi:predicted  nucleic acid-binding Zn-ribbon protein